MAPARNQPLLALFVIGLGASIAPMDFAVNVALPAITEAFALDVKAIRWVVVCYVVTYASLTLAFGKLGDVIGHRTVFRTGLIVGTLAFAACALAQTYAWLLFARTVQGIATALVLSCAPALIVAACGEARRTWALSRYSMTAALAGIVGPLAGGASMQLAGWAGVFWFRLPVALLALLSLALLPKPPAAPSSHSGLGVLSSVLLATGLAALLFSAALLPDTAYPAWPVAGGAAGLYLLFLFARRERGSAQRVLPSAALHDPSLRLSNLTSIMVHLVGFAIPLLVPYYLVRIGGFDASAIGVLLALATVGVLIASIFAPRTIRAIGQYRCTQLGVAFVALAQLLMAGWPPAPSMMELIPALMLHGAGIGLFQVGYADHVVASLHARDRGVAGSLTVLTRTLGVITGAVVLSNALQALEARQVAAGLTAHDAFYAAFRTIFVTSGLLLAGFTVWVAMRQK